MTQQFHFWEYIQRKQKHSTENAFIPPMFIAALSNAGFADLLSLCWGLPPEDWGYTTKGNCEPVGDSLSRTGATTKAAVSQLGTPS